MSSIKTILQIKRYNLLEPNVRVSTEIKRPCSILILHQAQMPGNFFLDDNDYLCSYMSHSVLEDSQGCSGGILDVTVFRDSLTRLLLVLNVCI